VSFAAKDIISNLFSGIILIIGKSIKVGDTIEVDGKKGYVERISLRSTIVVDDVGVKNIVPNSILTNNEYQLYKEPEIFRVDIIVGLPFNIDLENFRNYIIEKMGEYDEIADNPRPDVYAKEILFKESRVKVSFWIKDFNNKDKYKIIISNEIRKFINMGENDE
jgi:small-conductance mechanosensitive channel